MNARQRRQHARRVSGDHFRWPLGTRVEILPGHHSPAAVGMIGKVNKHGRPCTHRVNCIVEFPRVVMDLSSVSKGGEGWERFCHYVQFRHLRKVSR